LRVPVEAPLTVTASLASASRTKSTFTRQPRVVCGPFATWRTARRGPKSAAYSGEAPIARPTEASSVVCDPRQLAGGRASFGVDAPETPPAASPRPTSNPIDPRLIS
jgi:hypothetical protein